LKKQHPSEYPQEWGPKTLYAKIEEEAAGLEKLLKAGGCPPGFHQHPPYQNCHPADREHEGYSDEQAAGGLEAAHAVIDEAIVESKAAGADMMANQLLMLKRAVDPHNPKRAYAQLLAAADRFEALAKQCGASPNLKLRGQGMVARALARKVRQAAGKLRPDVGSAERGDA